MKWYPQPNAIVSTAWLASHLHDPGVRIVEVIWRPQTAYGWDAYVAGHIPGAVAWDYEANYGEVQGDVIAKNVFERQLSRSGITPKMTVVLYSSVNNLLATFEFWLMKYYGHGDVRLLDGDREKWLAENSPLEQTIPTYPPTFYKAKEPDESLRASQTDVLQAIGKEGVVLLDARSTEVDTLELPEFPFLPHTLYDQVNPLQSPVESNYANNQQIVSIGGLPAPQDLRGVSQPGDSSVYLKWLPVEHLGMVGFRVYRSSDGRTYEPLRSSFSTGFVNLYFVPGKCYLYAVTGYASDSYESPLSNMVTAVLSNTFTIFLPLIVRKISRIYLDA